MWRNFVCFKTLSYGPMMTRRGYVHSTRKLLGILKKQRHVAQSLQSQREPSHTPIPSYIKGIFIYSCLYRSTHP